MRIRVSVIRFLLEAGFLILVATATGLARLSALWIGVVMFGAWLLVAFVERSGARTSRQRAQASEKERTQASEAEAVPEAEREEDVEEPLEPEPQPEPEPEESEPDAEPERVLVAVPRPQPEPAPEPGPETSAETEPAVVPLVLRDSTPRMWNLWDLERVAQERYGRDPARDEERTLLVLHMREFANASGELPVEFDPLVREAFGGDLAELGATGLA